MQAPCKRAMSLTGPDRGRHGAINAHKNSKTFLTSCRIGVKTIKIKTFQSLKYHVKSSIFVRVVRHYTNK